MVHDGRILMATRLIGSQLVYDEVESALTLAEIRLLVHCI
jgi:hypothetical protein